MIRAFFVIAAVLIAKSGAVGGGIQVAEHSARATGMGGAVVAATGDATSLHINPASLSFFPGMHFSFGATVQIPEEKFTAELPVRTETKMKALVNFPPNFYISYGSSAGFGAGLGVSVPVAAKTEWDPDWLGKRIVTKSEIRIITVTPAFSIRPSDILALGVGLNIAVPKLLYEERIPVSTSLQPASDATATYEAGGEMAYGIQVGVLYRPIEECSIGLSYRSPMKMSIDEGRLTYRDVPSQFAGRLANGTFLANVPYPSEVRTGLCWQPASWISAAADLQYGLWSDLTSFSVSFRDPSQPTVFVPTNWKNVLNARLGVEIAIADIFLRGGFRSDHSPVPDETLSPGLPDADATVYCAGFGYRVGDQLLLDFAFEIVHFRDRQITSSILTYGDAGEKFNGVYSSRTTSIALSISYSWH